MRSFLVYHDTTQFVRVVQTMPLAGTMWAWLQPMQKSGAPMPRKTLVQRCVKDQVCVYSNLLLLVGMSDQVISVLCGSTQIGRS